ncbi:hypothetical protein C0995_012677 [Termitomyces sp. Mi166|nr:hypothetical protein C0995_012677 [Termitomyces sp. Mi166\
MELMITSILACLSAIEEGLQITFIAAQTAPKHSSTLALASKAPPSSLETSTIPTSQILQCVVQSTSNAPLAIPLTQELPPTNGQAQCYECTLSFPTLLHQGWGLKQAHNLSSSQLSAFAVGPARNEGHRFVTIRGTDQQISEALVVIGKCIAKRQVHTPQKQKTGNAVLGVAALALSSSNSGSVSSTPKPPTQQKRPPLTPTPS